MIPSRPSTGAELGFAIAPKMKHPIYVLPRGRGKMFLVSVILATGLAGCTPGEIRNARPYLSIDHASYAGKWNLIFPRWYTLYSILPGSRKTRCQRLVWLSSGRRKLKVANCSDANDQQIREFAGRIGRAFDGVEARYSHHIHVTNAVFYLVPPRSDYSMRSAQYLQPMGLEFKIAVRYSGSDPHASEVEAVRSTAHELYHMAERALAPRHSAHMEGDIPEEAKAALFESCLEQDTFGSVHEDAFDPGKQTDPRYLGDFSGPSKSASGNLQAVNTLARITGEDHRLSSPSEEGQFYRLCSDLIN